MRGWEGGPDERISGLDSWPFVHTRSAIKRYVLLASALIALAMSQPAWAQAPITIYCSILEEQCRLGVAAFEKATGVKVNDGAQEHRRDLGAAPCGSREPARRHLVGRTGRSHIQAAEDGLTTEYKSPMLSSCTTGRRPRNNRASAPTGIYLGALGIGYNTEGPPEPPASRAEMLGRPARSALPDEVQVSDPNSSGTAYVLLASLVQLMGEDKASTT